MNPRGTDTTGLSSDTQVAFNQGEYDPSSAEGQHTIAHELAHVRQQTGGAVSMLPKEEVQMEIDPDPGLEQEAEATAQRVMRGGELGVQRMADTDVHVQRSSETESASPGQYAEANKTAIGMVNNRVADLSQRVDSLEQKMLNEGTPPSPATEGSDSNPSPASTDKSGGSSNPANTDESGSNPFENVELENVGKDVALGLLGELPGGTFAAQLIEGMDDQMTRVKQLEQDLEHVDPPRNFVENIADRTTAQIAEQQTGEGEDPFSGGA